MKRMSLNRVRNICKVLGKSEIGERFKLGIK